MQAVKSVLLISCLATLLSACNEVPPTWPAGTQPPVAGASRSTSLSTASASSGSAGAAAGLSASGSATTSTTTTTRSLLIGDDSSSLSHREVPNISCRKVLSKDDELLLGATQQRSNEGSYYAALAQLDALPQDIAQVAITRADILRRIKAPEAENWYLALANTTCMAGPAEHGLGLLAARRSDYRQAIDHLSTAARLLPTDAGVRNDLGFAYLHVGLDAKAEFELRTASELAPDDRQSLLNLVLLDVVRGNTAAWLGWRDRLKLSDSERQQLSQSCDGLMIDRAFYGNPQGKTIVAQRCPLALT